MKGRLRRGMGLTSDRIRKLDRGLLWPEGGRAAGRRALPWLELPTLPSFSEILLPAQHCSPSFSKAGSSFLIEKPSFLS